MSKNKSTPPRSYSASEMRAKSFKNSTSGIGSYANSDLAKARELNRKTSSQSFSDQAKARDASYAAKKKAESGTSSMNSQKAIGQEVMKNRAASADGAFKGTNQTGGTGNGGGNPCHDDQGKFC